MAPIVANLRCFPACGGSGKRIVSEPTAVPPPLPRAAAKGTLLGRRRNPFPDDRFLKKGDLPANPVEEENVSQEESPSDELPVVVPASEPELSAEDIEPLARRPPFGCRRRELPADDGVDPKPLDVSSVATSSTQEEPPCPASVLASESTAATASKACAGGASCGGPAAAAAPRLTAEELRAALSELRAAAAALPAAEGAGQAAQLRPQLDAACDLVDSVLLGVCAHLPGKIASVERRPPSCAAGALGELRVRLADGPAVGEFATRSRQPCQLRLAEELSFALECPTADSAAATGDRRGSGVGPTLLLRTSGMELEALPEIVALRRRLHRELEATPEGFTIKSVGSWWVNNRDREFPVEQSKLRRLCDSFQEVASLPIIFQAKAFWGYLHACSLMFDVFEFRTEGGAVTVTAQTHLSDASDAQYSVVGSGMCKEMLQAHRALAERFAASTVNMGALFEAKALGYQGANPARVAKLFSAAQRWGPGPSGWHALDETWLCVDSRDFFGRVTQEQGRVLWQGAGAQPSLAAAAGGA